MGSYNGRQLSDDDQRFAHAVRVAFDDKRATEILRAEFGGGVGKSTMVTDERERENTPSVSQIVGQAIGLLVMLVLWPLFWIYRQVTGWIIKLMS